MGINLKTDLTQAECDNLRELCNFTPDELRIFNLRVADKTLTQISLILNMSVSTISRRLKNIKSKIAKAS